MYTLLIVHYEKHITTIKTCFVTVHYMTEKSVHLLAIIPATDVFPVPGFPLNTITGPCIQVFRLRLAFMQFSVTDAANRLTYVVHMEMECHLKLGTANTYCEMVTLNVGIKYM